MNLITSAQTQDHITPKQDSHWHKMLMNKESCIFNGSFAPTIVTNNEIRIGAGVGSHQGRFFDVETNTYDTVTINNGTQGENRIDIICQKITVNTSGGTQEGSWEVIQGTSVQGTPTAPTVPTADLDAGDTESYMPIIEVMIDGLNIASLDIIADVWSAADFEAVADLSNEIDTINSRASIVGARKTSNVTNTSTQTVIAMAQDFVIGEGLTPTFGTNMNVVVADANIKAIRVDARLIVGTATGTSSSAASVYARKNGRAQSNYQTGYGTAGANIAISGTWVIPVTEGDKIDITAVNVTGTTTTNTNSEAIFEAIY